MDICKICLEEINDYDDVYAPCNCRGNMNYIHIKCFIQAYILTNKSKCEICQMSFPVWNSNTYYIIPNNQHRIENNNLFRNFGNFQQHYYSEIKNILFKILFFILSLIYYIILFLSLCKIILYVSSIFEYIYYEILI